MRPRPAEPELRLHARAARVRAWSVHFRSPAGARACVVCVCVCACARDCDRVRMRVRPCARIRVCPCARILTDAMGPKISPAASCHCEGSASAGRTRRAACRPHAHRTLRRPLTAVHFSRPFITACGHAQTGGRQSTVLGAAGVWASSCFRPHSLPLSSLSLSLGFSLLLALSVLTLQPMSSHKSSQNRSARTHTSVGARPRQHVRGHRR